MNIIKGIENALSYLHHDCVPTIVHQDLTTNNILLNSEFEAIVADFGIIRPLNPNSSNLTTLAGTYGYIAPGNYYYYFFYQHKHTLSKKHEINY